MNLDTRYMTEWFAARKKEYYKIVGMFQNFEEWLTWPNKK